ncbi:MAG: hypothetical protein EOO63_14610, partial [Hymenobacter sp.]
MFHKYHAAACFALGLATLPKLASAQAALVQQKEVGADGQPTRIEFTAAGRATLSATSAKQVLRQQLSLGSKDEMRAARTEVDELG